MRLAEAIIEVLNENPRPFTARQLDQRLRLKGQLVHGPALYSTLSRLVTEGSILGAYHNGERVWTFRTRQLHLCRACNRIGQRCEEHPLHHSLVTQDEDGRWIADGLLCSCGQRTAFISERGHVAMIECEDRTCTR